VSEARPEKPSPDLRRPMRPICGLSSCAARSRSSPMRSLRCSELHPHLGHLDRRISRRGFPAAPL